MVAVPLLSGTSKDILDNIEHSDPNLAEGLIRHLMFVFEDLLLIQQDGIKEVSDGRTARSSRWP